MSINIEKLYTNACDVLRNACIHLQGEKDGMTFYEKVTKDPELWLKNSYIGDVTSALEIWHMAKEEISKSKGGSTYTVLKKFIKNIKGYRTDINGAWLDEDGRQCLCDGYRAIRLNTPIEGLKEPDNPNHFDLGKVFPHPSPTEMLKLPTTGELKAYIADPASPRNDKTVLYDFGEGLPMVDAKYLKDMLDVFPDAIATYDGTPSHAIYFHSEKGDGILLPIRKRAA